MRPNLSLSNIAATLALLGTSAVLTVACGGATPPAATEAPAQPAAVGGQKSCSANGCGASSKGDKDTSATATTPAAADPNANNAVATPTATASAAPTTTPPTAANVKPVPKPVAKPGMKPPVGQSSCGAGTCAADPKKK